MRKGKHCKFKPSWAVRIRRLLERFLDSVEFENKSLRYIADAVLCHFLKDEESLKDFLVAAGGVRARRMYEAVRQLYKKADPFGDILKERLRGIVFSQDVARKQKQIKRAVRVEPVRVQA